MLPMTGTGVWGWPGVRGQVSPTCMLESFVLLGSLLVWFGLVWFGEGCVSVCLCLCIPVSMCLCVCVLCVCVSRCSCVFICVCCVQICDAHYYND